MTFDLIGELPKHLYCFVDSRFTHDDPAGFIPALWFGLVSHHSRAWGCTVLLENGAVYRNLPPHAIAFESNPEEHSWFIEDAQTWDCYGNQFSALEYSALRGLDCLARTATNRQLPGQYIFTAAPIGDAYSASPDQAKEFIFIQLDNGRLTIQPTNHVVFRERSFTKGDLVFPTGMRRQKELWACE